MKLHHCKAKTTAMCFSFVYFVDLLPEMIFLPQFACTNQSSSRSHVCTSLHVDAVSCHYLPIQPPTQTFHFLILWGPKTVPHQVCCRKSTKFRIFLMEACRVKFVLKNLEVDIMLRKKKGDYGLIPFSPEGSSTENFRISGTVWALSGRAGTTSEEAESRLTWNSI